MDDRIRRELMQLQDLKYREFQCGLIPTVDPETVIGVRTPALRAFAKALAKTEAMDAFLRALPHDLFEENQLHAFLLSEMKDFDRCIGEVRRFLPYIDNWATCDQLSPKVFKKHRAELLPFVLEWIGAKEPYTIRFGVGMLMQHYLDEDFVPAYPALAAGVRSEEYYVRMMVAWYFATALAKQYEHALPWLENRRLDAWTHNKAIQKAVESYRITPSQKDHLRTLRVRRG